MSEGQYGILEEGAVRKRKSELTNVAELPHEPRVCLGAHAQAGCIHRPGEKRRREWGRSFEIGI